MCEAYYAALVVGRRWEVGIDLHDCCCCSNSRRGRKTVPEGECLCLCVLSVWYLKHQVWGNATRWGIATLAETWHDVDSLQGKSWVGLLLFWTIIVARWGTCRVEPRRQSRGTCLDLSRNTKSCDFIGLHAFDKLYPAHIPTLYQPSSHLACNYPTTQSLKTHNNAASTSPTHPPTLSTRTY